MEKAWRVTMLIWNKNTSSGDNAEAHKFVVLQHTEERAKLRATMDAAKLFPPDEGWTYDVDNATVEELSHEQVGEMLDEIRERNMKESDERLEQMRAEFRKMGINL